MTKAHCALRTTVQIAALALAMLGGCATPPKPPPQPRQAPSQPPLPDAAAAPGQTKSTAPAPAGGQGYGAPSANAAEVEVEEVPVDGSGVAAAPQSSSNQQAPLAHMGDSAGGKPPGQTGGGGGAAPSAMAPVNLGGGEAGQGVRPGPPAAADSDLIGPDLQIGTVGAAPAAVDVQALLQRARAAAELERNGGAPSGRTDGRGQRLAAPPVNRGGGGAGDIGTGLGNTPDVSGETSGQHQPMAATAPSPDLQDRRDDDIVARQLREAASTEQDAVLREKLWQEYRRYKSGL